MSFLVDCAVLPSHIENQCTDYKRGGFPSIAVVDSDATVVGDWANSTKWLADIASGKVKVANQLKASLPEPSPQKVDNPVACGAQQILDGFDWKVEWTDGQVSTYNDSFYQTLNKKAAYLVLWNYDEDEIIVIDKKVTFTSMKMAPASNREFQSYKVEGEFVSGKDWLWYAVAEPTGVFTF